VLVDLDRGVIVRKLAAGSRDAMLVRLQRYWLRHRQHLPATPSRAERMRCLRSLLPDRDARHDWWRRLAKAVAAAVRRRRLFGRRPYLGA